MDGMLTTAQLLKRLSARGVAVESSRLHADVHDCYLPPPSLVGNGLRAGVHGLWPPWVLERATRLYRLRKRGVKGTVLKLILFMRDGWGWSSIQPTIIGAYRKAIRVSQIGLRELLHNPDVPADVSLVLEDASEMQRERLASRLAEPEASQIRVNPDTMGFVWGVGLFGQPVSGGTLQSLAPLVSYVDPTFSDGDAREGLRIVQQTMTDEGMTWDKRLAILKEMDEQQASRSMVALRFYIGSLRSALHKTARDNGSPGASTNPLTLYGHWEEAQAAGYWANIPGRVTPTQHLALTVGQSILANAMWEQPFGPMLDVMQAISDTLSNSTE